MTDTHGSHDAMPDNHDDDMAATPPTTDTGVTAAEAAVLLGISERIVLRRLKQGTLQGYKVEAGRGTVWRVMLDGMAATPPASDVTPPALAEFAHAVIDELRQEYRDEIDRLQRDNQQLAGQVGFLQAKLQSAEERAPRSASSYSRRQRMSQRRRPSLNRCSGHRGGNACSAKEHPHGRSTLAGE